MHGALTTAALALLTYTSLQAQAHTALQFLPATAHLTFAGSAIVQPPDAFGKHYFELCHRLRTILYKDWCIEWDHLIENP
jgi:hypothetical protein